MLIKKDDLIPVIKLLTKEKLASLIDHTDLKPEILTKKIQTLCDEAETYGFAGICVNSARVADAYEYIKTKNYNVRICSVIGFPLGQMKIEAKAYETKCAVADGAEEIDMVINVGKLRELFVAGEKEKEKFHEYLLKDVSEVVRAADGKLVKVILETGYLRDEEIAEGCRICIDAGAKFVKTSTGFGPMGAYPHHLKIMRDTVGNNYGVKASGGITTFLDAIRCIYASANSLELLNPDRFRIGASAGINIINSMTWAKYTDAWFMDLLPCSYCPSNNIAKLPEEIKSYYVSKCKSCNLLTEPEKEERRKYRDL